VQGQVVKVFNILKERELKAKNDIVFLLSPKMTHFAAKVRAFPRLRCDTCYDLVFLLIIYLRISQKADNVQGFHELRPKTPSEAKWRTGWRMYANSADNWYLSRMVIVLSSCVLQTLLLLCSASDSVLMVLPDLIRTFFGP
jgi:hypothetical protein